MKVFTILSSNNRLNPNKKDNTMFTGSYDPNSSPVKIKTARINVGDAPALETLLNEIERLNFELMDQSDAAQEYKTVHNNLIIRNQELEARTDSLHACEESRLQLKSDLSSAEHEIVRLKKDLDVEIGNRDHFRSLVAQQDAFLKELKAQIEQWKVDKSQALETKTAEADHLALKAIQLTEENEKLAKENDLFRQSNNRLLEETRKLYDKSQDLECEGCRTGEMGNYCGGCLGCLLRQAEHTIEQIDKTLTDAQSDRNSYRAMVTIQFSMISIMKPFLAAEASRWFGYGTHAQEALEQVHKLQKQANAECDKLLKNVQARLKTEEKKNKDDEYELPKPNQYLAPTSVPPAPTLFGPTTLT